ncbi:hypothetical protein Tco_1279972, partial [Tanacetum coccineum]
FTPFYKAFQASADVPEIYMQEFWATASVRNRSIRFKMNNKKYIFNLEYFREMLQICPKIRNQKFDEPPVEQEIITFLINWHYVRDDPMFTTINVISRHDDTQLYGAILPKELTNKDIRNFESYKEYYAIALGEVPPKTKASVHKKKADSDTKPKEKPPTDPKEKPLRKAEATYYSSQASGSGDGVHILSKVPDEQTFSNDDDDDDDDDDDEDDDEDDDANKDSDAHDDDDDDATESDDDGDNITHPKLSTFSTDDQEEQDDEEEQEDDDEDEEEISDQLVRTPSDYQTSNEREKQKDDDRLKNGEEDKEGDVTNVALEGGDVDMTEADTTEDTEDAHMLLTLSNNKVYLCQIWFQSSSLLLRMKKIIKDQTSYGIASSLSELELKKILMDKIEENKSIDRSDVQKNLYNALVKAYNTYNDLLSSYGDVIIISTTRTIKTKMKNPPLDQTERPRAGDQARKLSHPKNQLVRRAGQQVL